MPIVPTFLMMTPPTPSDHTASPGQGFGLGLLRPRSSQSQGQGRRESSSSSNFFGGGGGGGASSSRPTSSASTLEPERRRSAGSTFLRDKLTTLTQRMGRQPSAIRDEDGGAEIEAEGESTETGGGVNTGADARRRLGWTASRVKTG